MAVIDLYAADKLRQVALRVADLGTQREGIKVWRNYRLLISQLKGKFCVAHITDPGLWTGRCRFHAVHTLY